MNTTAEWTPSWHKVCNTIENHLLKYVPGGFKWAAQQSGLDRDDVYALCIGNGVCSFNLEEARVRMDDDEYIRQLATEILGFPPDSPQDYQRRLDEAVKQRGIEQIAVDMHTKQLNYWKSIEAEMRTKLAATR